MATQLVTSGDNIDVALELFEKGIAKESIGKFSDAILLYREAFKLNEKVDKVYRNRLSMQKDHDHSNDSPLMRNPELLGQKLNRLSLTDDGETSVSQVRHDDGEPTNDQEGAEVEGCPLLELLTDDVLIHILKYLAMARAPDWVSLARSNKRLAHLGFDTSSLWRDLSLDIYSTVYPSISKKEIEFQSHNIYKGWKDMYFKKPFLKFGGVYISICTYLREGSSAHSLSWTNPIHIITYYRYLRFFKSGTCLRLLTIAEPHEVVPKFTKDWKENGLKDVFNGFWTLEEDGKLTIEGEGVVKDCQFTQELRVSGRRHNQLKWISSYCINAENVQTFFSLSKEKWFAFSRVKSWPIE
ncbi:SCF ubiquitin ligase complex subunit [Saccharomycopsis crataegensis]|uniref:SCF ubiquitin ligase complex subunit n=1 Tax=Saccharomycopsis crataegensis TaxID=43959 RepID=A0AAV5QEI6_9ASCO|nr:SCF ubiquitin ligase complex subunit [Saccharomycopsis crataegensis]